MPQSYFPPTPASASERNEGERREAEWRSEDGFAIRSDNSQICSRVKKAANTRFGKGATISLNVFLTPEVYEVGK
jgi:hypothetical protein